MFFFLFLLEMHKIISVLVSLIAHNMSYHYEKASIIHITSILPTNRE
jgi:hypothetical protein